MLHSSVQQCANWAHCKRRGSCSGGSIFEMWALLGILHEAFISSLIKWQVSYKHSLHNPAVFAPPVVFTTILSVHAHFQGDHRVHAEEHNRFLGRLVLLQAVAGSSCLYRSIAVNADRTCLLVKIFRLRSSSSGQPTTSITQLERLE